MQKFLKFKVCKGTIVYKNIQLNNSPFLHFNESEVCLCSLV